MFCGYDTKISDLIWGMPEETQGFHDLNIQYGLNITKINL